MRCSTVLTSINVCGNLPPESRKPSPSANWPNAVLQRTPCSYGVASGTEAGWLEWQAQSGRGKRGQLRFLVTPESLRRAMEQALAESRAAERLVCGELRLLFNRLWADNGKTIRPRCVLLLSPARTATTGALPGRYEAASGRQIFSGLTRFDNNTQRPIGDLAHHWRNLY